MKNDGGTVMELIMAYHAKGYAVDCQPLNVCAGLENHWRDSCSNEQVEGTASDRYVSWFRGPELRLAVALAVGDVVEHPFQGDL